MYCIRVYIHSAPNSSRSENSRFGPAREMTSDLSHTIVILISYYPNPPCQRFLWQKTGAPGENPGQKKNVGFRFPDPT
jgi:hypothetical protein